MIGHECWPDDGAPQGECFVCMMLESAAIAMGDALDREVETRRPNPRDAVSQSSSTVEVCNMTDPQTFGPTR